MAGAGAHLAPPALFTDLYQLTMLQAYHDEGLREMAVFELFVRRLPPRRNVLLACGLGDALRYLERLRFDSDALDYLASLGLFTSGFLEELGRLRFTGDVRALPEGTPVFAGEPLLQVRAPLPQAQLVETCLLNQVHFQTLAASKALRVVRAASGRPVVDFGMRRIHGTDAALKAARAFHVAGAAATSNVLAGRVYGLPLSGTMAHSYVQVHGGDAEAFRAFAASHREPVLLVDTVDTLAGVREVARLARALGEDFRVRAVRLDSGDLAELARGARAILDEAGLAGVQVFASGGLDEEEVARLVAAEAPIDGFGVGTRMGVSADAPFLDCAYKLVEYAGKARLKLSGGKETLPGGKEVFRVSRGGEDVLDVVARAGEEAAAVLEEVRGRAGAGDLGSGAAEGGAPLAVRPVLADVMRRGRRLAAGEESLDAARERAAAGLVRLPGRIRDLAPAEPPYPVLVSAALSSERERRAAELRSRIGV
ncbi:MAG: nicotinate phosphoribosyltransferase [Gemmatimonadota bacterium]